MIVLPNNGNIRPVANRVDELTAKRVWVVPTETIAEGFAALLAYDPEAGRRGQRRGHGGRRPARWCPARSPGPCATRTPAGPVAHRRLARACPATASRWWATPWPDAACALLDVLVTDAHDLVTIIEGEGSGAADTRRITEWLAGARGPTSRPRCTTAASRCTRTCSPSSEPARVTGTDVPADRGPAAGTSGRRSGQLSELPVTVLQGVGTSRAGDLAELGIDDGARPHHPLPAPLHRRHPHGHRSTELAEGEKATVLAR